MINYIKILRRQLKFGNEFKNCFAFRTKLLLLVLLAFAQNSYGQTNSFFVDPQKGNDLNNGTKNLPYATITKALSTVAIGDTIYLRGAVYNISSTISLSKTGTSSSYYKLFSYNDEIVILDFSKQTSSDGIKVNGNYWHLKGIICQYSAHNGIAINGSYNIIENCVTRNNRNTGMQLGNGASYNRILNCDSYYNFDPPSGGDADGFAPKLNVGTGNYFYGCRAWQNSDDGWDGYLRPSDNVNTVIENCWSFMNGYLKDGSPISTGNGNGFKMGGGDSSNKDSLRHNMIIKNSLCFDNRVKGFDQNNNRGTMTLLNCTGFRNGSYNFSIAGKIRITSSVTVKNCVSYLSTGINLLSTAVQQSNSWLAGYSASSQDFESLDTIGVRGSRKKDGSLPDIKFMHLAPTSALIDAGVDVGILFIGKAPDLGAFEFGMLNPTDIISHSILPNEFRLEQNYPNPFNPVTAISYQIPSAIFPNNKSSVLVTVKVLDLLGREVSTLINEEKAAGFYTVNFNAGKLSSGIYFYRILAGKFSQTKKMVLTK